MGYKLVENCKVLGCAAQEREEQVSSGDLTASEISAAPRNAVYPVIGDMAILSAQQKLVPFFGSDISRAHLEAAAEVIPTARGTVNWSAVQVARILERL